MKQRLTEAAEALVIFNTHAFNNYEATQILSHRHSFSKNVDQKTITLASLYCSEDVAPVASKLFIRIIYKFVINIMNNKPSIHM